MLQYTMKRQVKLFEIDCFTMPVHHRVVCSFPLFLIDKFAMNCYDKKKESIANFPRKCKPNWPHTSMDFQGQWPRSPFSFSVNACKLGSTGLLRSGLSFSATCNYTVRVAQSTFRFMTCRQKMDVIFSAMLRFFKSL